MTNQHFNYLMELQKHFVDDTIELPKIGERADPIPVLSDTTKDAFQIDSDRRGTYTLSRIKLQERYANEPEILIRLEIDSKPHMNPDGHITSKNHIHVYTEEYGLGLAYDLDSFPFQFSNVSNINATFIDFCKYCNVSTKGKNIQGVI